MDWAPPGVAALTLPTRTGVRVMVAQVWLDAVARLALIDHRPCAPEKDRVFELAAPCNGRSQPGASMLAGVCADAVVRLAARGIWFSLSKDSVGIGPPTQKWLGESKDTWAR